MNEWKKAVTWEEKLLFWFGFFGTMPIVELMGFTMFTWFSLALVGLILMKLTRRLRLSRIGIFFLLMTGMQIVSSLLCMRSGLPSYWKSQAMKNAVWRVLFIIIFVYYACGERFDKGIFYIKGVYYAAIFQAFWGIVQLGLYQAGGIVINKLLFYDILHVELAEYVQMRGSSIAITGLCWNAGNLAALLVIGYMLTPSLYLKLLFIGVGALSGSRTLILGLIAVIGLEAAVRAFSSLKKRVNGRLLIAVMIVFVGGAAFVMFSEDLLATILSRLQEVTNTFNSKFLETQASSRIHARYWTSIAQVTKWNSPLHNLLGYGVGCSGYPFAALFDQFADHAWTVECDFINNLWGTGYLGFALWYGWYIICISKGTRIDIRYPMLFLALLVEGVTYNVTFDWCYFFLLFTFAHIYYGRSIFSRGLEATELGGARS